MNINFTESGNISPQFDRVLGSITGIVRQILITRPERGGPPVFTSHVETAEPTSMNNDSDSSRDIVASGKGLTRRECLMTTVGEVLERYCLHTVASEDRTGETYNEKEERLSESVVPWKYLNRLHESQIEEFSNFEYLTKDQAIGWVSGRNLITGEPTAVPSQLVAGTTSSQDEPQHFFSTTNGTAVGQSFDEAVLNAILEFIERDAFLRAWYGLTDPGPLAGGVGSKSVTPHDDLSNENIDFIPFALPSPTDIPVIGCAVRDHRERGPAFVIACSAALSIDEALRDACVEAAQSYYYAMYLLASHDPKEIKPEQIYNFEENVVYYAQPDHVKETSHLYEGKAVSPPDGSPSSVLEVVSNLDSIDATPIYVDVITDDIANLGISAAAVFIPELLDLSLPSIPHQSHPVLEHGDRLGIPHPLP